MKNKMQIVMSILFLLLMGAHLTVKLIVPRFSTPEPVDPFVNEEDLLCTRYSDGFIYRSPKTPEDFSIMGDDRYWIRETDVSARGYCCFLYSLLRGDPRSLLPLYYIAYKKSVCRWDIDPNYMLTQTREECAQDNENLMAYWEQVIREVWGDAYFYREKGKMRLPRGQTSDAGMKREAMQSSLELLEKAKELGDLEARFQAVYPFFAYDETILMPEWKKVWPEMVKIADAGYPAAQFLVGWELVKKDRKKEDCAKGVAYLLAASKQRNKDALARLSVIYMAEQGNVCIKRDVRKALVYSHLYAMIEGTGDDKLEEMDTSFWGITKEQNKDIVQEARAMYAELVPDSGAIELEEARKRLLPLIPSIKETISSRFPWIKWSLASPKDWVTLRNAAEQKQQEEHKEQADTQ